MKGIQSFIVEHYLDKEIDVYCGGEDTFRGKVKAIADDVLPLEKDGVHTHICVDKIIAIWPKK